MSQTRNPWRTRVGLLGVINAGRGLAVALGFSESLVTGVVTVAVALVSFLVDVRLVKDGEAETTPLADPRDSKGQELKAA